MRKLNRNKGSHLPGLAVAPDRAEPTTTLPCPGSIGREILHIFPIHTPTRTILGVFAATVLHSWKKMLAFVTLGDQVKFD